MEHGRFQFADGRLIPSALIETERSCDKGELPESPNNLRHSGPGRSPVSGPHASLYASDIALSDRIRYRTALARHRATVRCSPRDRPHIYTGTDYRPKRFAPPIGESLATRVTVSSYFVRCRSGNIFGWSSRLKGHPGLLLSPPTQPHEESLSTFGAQPPTGISVLTSNR